MQCKGCGREATEDEDAQAIRTCEEAGLLREGRVWTCAACLTSVVPYPVPFSRVFEVACPRCNAMYGDSCTEPGCDLRPGYRWVHSERTRAWRERETATRAPTLDLS